jgi:PAS domain S-box-containing protein
VERLLGYKPQDFIGWPVSNLGNILTPESLAQAIADISFVLKGETISTTIYQFVAKDGTIKYGEVSGSPLMRKGKIIGIISVARDITGRRQAEEALREREAILQITIDEAPICVAMVDLNKRFLKCNKAFCTFLGYSEKEMQQKTIADITFPEDLEIGMADLRAIAGGEKKSSVVQKRYVRKDNAVVWGETNINLIRNNQGKPMYFLPMIIDITERKKAESEREVALDALRKSEDKYRTLIETTDTGYVIIDQDGLVRDANSEYVRLTGHHDLNEITGRNVLEWTAESEKEKNAEAVKACFDKGYIRNLEIDYVDAKGNVTPIEINATCMKIEGKTYTITICRDITRRKQMEAALREGEELYRTIFENTGTSIIIIEEDMTISMANEEFVRNTGYSSDEINGRMKWTEIIHPDDLGWMVEQHQLRRETQEGALPSYEFRYITKTGHLKDTLLTIKLVPGTKKSIASLIDITERKKAEDSLRENENRLRAQYNGNPIPTYTWQKQGDEFILTDFNDSAKTSTNGQRDSFLGRQASEMYKNRQEILVNIQRCFDEKRIIKIEAVSEHFMPGKFVIITFVFIPPDLVMVHMEDITERKKSEEALRNSEEKYRNIFENSIEGIYQSTIDGRIITANAAFARMAGYESPEALIESIKDIGTQLYVHSEDRKRFMEIREAKGFIEGFEVEFYKKDGSRFWVVINARMVKDEQGKILYIEGLIEDITNRKITEKQLHLTLDSLRKAVGTTIQVLVSAVESRDAYTFGHQSRSADLAGVIATEMGLAQDKIEGVRMAGIIHDIGKLSIPAEILSKPTHLTNLEFSLIKEHSRSGYEILKNVESPWPLAEIVYQHHERMDGSGYPRNLKGDEILMESRILSVADVVEAMASHRPYREALGIEAALEEIEKNKGIFYDIAVVDACLRLFREKGYRLTLNGVTTSKIR